MAILLPTCVADGPKSSPPSGEGSPPRSLLARGAPDSTTPLVFPPERPGMQPRPALGDGPNAPLVVARPARAPEVAYPTAGPDDEVQITRDRIAITFSEPMMRPGVDETAKGPVEARPKSIAILPEVRGRAVWTDATHLELAPDDPLPVGVQFKVRIDDLTSAAGARMASPWERTFVRRVEIAGKILGHDPRPGEPRVIAIHPGDASTIAPSQELAVLYDQPLDLDRANRLLRLETSAGKAVPLSMAHPPGPTFQGVAVDRRFVIVMKPTAPLAREESYKLIANKAYPEGKTEARSYAVAKALAIEGVECPSGEDDCSVTGDRVETKGMSLLLALNNPITLAPRDLQRLVHVTPAVDGVRAYAWDDRLVITGFFERSTTCDVSLVGLVDRYGSRLAAPFHATLARAPEDASVTMPAGVLLLDDEGMKRFPITTRNVAEATLSFWPVEDARLKSAVQAVRAGSRPAGSVGIRVPVPIGGAENELVRTEVDLAKTLEKGVRYVAAVDVASTAYGADWAERSVEPIALVSPVGAAQLAVHVERKAAQTVVHVARLATGEPVAGARVTRLDDPDTKPATTDGDGLAALGPLDEGWLDVTVDGAGSPKIEGPTRMLVDLARPAATAAELFPRIGTSQASEGDASAARSVVLTDRGIYRPGSEVHLFANLRRPEGGGLAPMANASVVVRALGPSNEEIRSEAITTDDTGSVTFDLRLAKNAKLGRHRLVVQRAGDEAAELAEALVQVADFEAPRFTVDVDASASDARHLAATVRARYLFGAPMEGARVSWTARREPAAIDEGPFEGFLFRPLRDPWDERPRARWARAGELTAAADGTASVSAPISLEGSLGPQRFTVEAEVTDASFRAIAGRASTVVHPADRYAGLRVGRRWVGKGEPFHVELGVVGRDGKAVVGATASAVLRELTWSRVARREAGGALSHEWTETAVNVGRCSVKTAAEPVSCDLTPRTNGNFEIHAEIDGRSGGAVSVWSWGGPGSRGPEIPSRGRALEIIPDKPSYAPGDSAKLFLTSPFAAATAIVTTDGAGAKPRAVRVEGSATVIDVPISGADAPQVHAMVTLLPIAAKGAGAEHRIGAVRLPIRMDGARLALEVTPAKRSYRPGDDVEIGLQARDGNAPAKGARLAISVADEGVLRLTGFHAPDPVTALRPGRALFAEIHDTRTELVDLVSRSHVAGDGDEGSHGRDAERSLTRARKTFAETAFWKPDLRADDEGRATVRFRLPDNLTTFRVMAIALDAAGKGASAETSFRVTKPVLLAPALPRFASLGDTFEAAALLHATETPQNEGDPREGESGSQAVRTAARSVVVALAGHEQRVTLAPGGKARVAFPVRVACEGPAADGEILACPTAIPGERPALHLSFEARGDGGERLDAVEQTIPATLAGLDERPRIAGSFAGRRSIALRVPAHVAAPDGHDALVVTLGAEQWPELGERLRYLLDYPHGCVEQTTSSTLPLIAARDIAPRIGLDAVSDAELRTKIRAGIDRLATMRTSTGGLGYWPGDSMPNLYGTAYAIRALVLAKAAGVEPPADMVSGMASYLEERMLTEATPPEVTAAIAQSLAELGRLSPSSADPLFDTASKQTVFGSASLALALAALPGQDDRVAALLDRVEAGIDDRGELTQKVGAGDFHYYGSPMRSRAQAALALRRLRPASPKLPGLLSRIATATERYTTQATAYSLLALADELRATSTDASDVRVLLDGREIADPVDLPGGRRFQIPLADVAGREATLEMVSASDRTVGFAVRATWRRPAEEASAQPFVGAQSPALFRVYTDAKGGPVDLSAVHPGDVLRVGLLARRPSDVPGDRFGYLAITDRLPAGFEPVQQDLATVASHAEAGSAHPFARWMQVSDEQPSFVEMHDDRVNVYFDRAWGDDVVATYLVRATTPGTFAAPPATAELMYEPDSLGATEPQRVVVR